MYLEYLTVITALSCVGICKYLSSEPSSGSGLGNKLTKTKLSKSRTFVKVKLNQISEFLVIHEHMYKTKLSKNIIPIITQNYVYNKTLYDKYIGSTNIVFEDHLFVSNLLDIFVNPEINVFVKMSNCTDIDICDQDFVFMKIHNNCITKMKVGNECLKLFDVFKEDHCVFLIETNDWESSNTKCKNIITHGKYFSYPVTNSIVKKLFFPNINTNELTHWKNYNLLKNYKFIEIVMCVCTRII